MIVGEHGWPDWKGETVVIVASGASAKAVALTIAHGRAKVIAVNESWRLCPWADVLYGCDDEWWKLRGGVPEFAGIKVGYGQAACLAYGLRKVNIKERCSDILLDPVGVISDGGSKKGADEVGGNSAWQATNLVLQWGPPKVIAWVGLDLCGEHWHGRHPKGLGNPSGKLFERWRESFDAAAERFKELGVTVFNCSPASILAAYPKVALEEAIEHGVA